MTNAVLKPGGLVFMCDFVGPTRFQWHKKQLEIVNGILNTLPDKYKKLPNGEKLNRVFRPSIARMIFKDPSEAIESSNIFPLMDEQFEV